MAEKFNMREAALDTLIDMERNHKLSHIAIGESLMRYQFASKQDRAFYTHLCEGVMERQIYLDYVLDSFSKVKMKKCKPLIRNLLRISAYQILFMNVRDAAACNEAVAIAKKRGFRSLSGFVNGVLRSLVRGKEQIVLPDKNKEPMKYASVRYSMPLWLVEFLKEKYGEKTMEMILDSFLQVRPTTIRTNLSAITPKELERELLEEKVTVSPGHYFDYAMEISGYNYLGKLKAFRKGLFTVQDESSMFPVEMADLKVGDQVLDVCAAPGGKTFHAADRVRKDGRVIARDLTEYKTELIEENKDRIQYSQVEIQQWDARVPDESLFGTMDVVLADLPCSGLGIMGRKNDIKYHISMEQMEELVQLQREILSVVWQYVRPGGQLIFSTCTLNPAENEENVRWISEHTPLSAVSIEEKLPESLQGRTGAKGYLQLIPGVDACDGFFVSKFIRGGK
ncbi:MAG: 16S rRNA (cytosine(967)-C(5))-methyltransferase RsmB [Lachnospiraceae bacterium]|nr:16S rRNA (cytosine(967)-C(5))-methyltransferase RsmB [Lachnospiraceae bacterium]